MGVQRRALITGCGALSAFGAGVDVFWDGLVSGRSALGPIRSFDATGYAHPAAGEVKDFYPERVLTGEAATRLDRTSQFAIAAAYEALGDSSLDLESTDRTRVGVILGTTLGGMIEGENYQRAAHAGTTFPARRLLHLPYYAVSGGLARELGLRGPVIAPSIACASGTHAVGLALELIRRDQADVFIVGGAEALCAFVVSGFDCLRAGARDTARPFDANRSGLLLGEGAAILIVEEMAHAAARGVAGSVEVCGSALAGDATHITAPARDGSGAARAMRSALDDAAIAPTAIDFISAHGTGTVYNDAMEVAAIVSVFGDAAPRIPVNSIKGAIGHTLGAAGAFEAIMAARVITEGIIPPTANCEQIDPACTLDVVRGTARHGRVDTVLSTSSAFAGNNATIVLQRHRA
jgi:3-oxoacyl-[acyl-carrier-protein] synthase II